MITVSPATASVAHGGSTQQFTVSDNNFFQWYLEGATPGSPDPTNSSISSTGLFTSGAAAGNAGTCNVFAKRFDGERSAASVVTVT